MIYPLGIFAPFIGGRSETFIKRHMEALLPSATAVVAGSSEKPYGGHWTVDGPLMILDHAQPIRLRHQIRRAMAQKLGGASGDDLAKKNVERFLQKHDIQVVMGEFLSWSLPWLDVVQSLGIRVWGHAHGYDISANLREPKWRTGYLRYNQADGVITMSEVSRKRLVDLGLSAEKVHVIPYGVDVPAQPLIRPAQSIIRCLAVGRMVSKKAPILTLDAFRRAAEIVPTLRLDYVGGGELFPAAQQFVQAFNLNDRVTLHGARPSDVVMELMRAADMFMQHSITDPETGDEEGLPVGILEAMAQSLPVVSTHHAGIPEAVQDGETGYLVKEGDSEAMAERLVMLARDHKLRLSMGAAGWMRASEHYTWEKERVTLLRLLGLER